MVCLARACGTLWGPDSGTHRSHHVGYRLASAATGWDVTGTPPCTGGWPENQTHNQCLWKCQAEDLNCSASPVEVEVDLALALKLNQDNLHRQAALLVRQELKW